MAETVQLSKFGSSFATRERAKLIVKTIRPILALSSPEITIQLKGVRVISYSFADEFIEQLSSVLSSPKHPITIAMLDGTSDVSQVFTETIRRRKRIHSEDDSHDPLPAIAVA